MIVGNIKDLPVKMIESSEVNGASIQVLVSPKEGWEGYVMRVLHVEKNGYTPKHSHPWPHINYIIEGEGELMIEGIYHKISSGSYAYVPGGALHQFKNIGENRFSFICIVPEVGHR